MRVVVRLGVAWFATICGVVVAFLLLLGMPAEAEKCSPSGPAVRVDVKTLPQGSVAGYSGVQLENAALIMNAAQALGLDRKAQTIGVMTAMGESSLKVLGHGDQAGPDSRGLFQQRAEGWGSLSDRMDPTISATNFFKALMRVENWHELEPTEAAHQTQNNADPNHYAPRWQPAVSVVEALAGVSVIRSDPGARNPSCGAAAPAPAGGGGWIRPSSGPLTSPFGMRWGREHKGVDLGAPCSAPILAASSGVVSTAGPVAGYGNLITIDHGSGVVTAYAHMENTGVLVHAGQQVSAGAEIGKVGSAGHSTGCHLHFEVRVNGEPVDPAPFMAEREVTV